MTTLMFTWGNFSQKINVNTLYRESFQQIKKVHICILHNEIELKNEELTSKLQIETMSNDDNNEATNVCWENSIIQMVLNVLQPVYDDL